MEENKFSLNMERMNEILKKYKEDFSKYFPEEKYKWQAVKHFQSIWDIDATDFTAMFENATSKTLNLLDSGNHFPRGMLLEFCKIDENSVREIFRTLYDETLDLKNRVENFLNESNRLLKIFDPTGKKNHYQNTNSISTFLWLKHPDKYYIYKYSEYIAVAEVVSPALKPKRDGSVDSMKTGFKLYGLINTQIKSDNALRRLFENVLDESCYSDLNFITATIDVGFYISRYLKSSWIVAANPKYYDVHGAFKKFSVIDWKQGNQNISEGDTVYIYISDEIKRIEYKTVVLKANMEKSEIDDSEFQIDNSNYADSKKMQLQLLDSVETQELSFSNLQRHGLKTTLQSPEKITTKLVNYIEQFFGGENMPTTNNYDYYVKLLKSNHNIILHGAPGTGKTYLAKQIANAMGEKGDGSDVEIGFVQFHPSYDYTDFVEGLRPRNGDDGQIGFERKDGVFKEFCKRAVKSIKNSESQVDNFDESWKNLVDYLNENDNMDISLLSGKGTFPIELNEYGTGLATRTYMDETREDWISGKSKFFSKDQLYNIYKGLPGVPMGGHDNYRKAIVKTMKEKFGLLDYDASQASIKALDFDSLNFEEKKEVIKRYLISNTSIYIDKDFWSNPVKILRDKESFSFQLPVEKGNGIHDLNFEDIINAKKNDDNKILQYTILNNAKNSYIPKNIRKNFIFIIDEINRGEISKIFGELFFSIDPGYRGEKGLVQTQYQNLVEEGDIFKKGFFIPENVYIIGTMNDIDRSVESMDFAMRRRFVFKEITADQSAKNMNLGDEAKRRMTALNEEISKIDGLGSSYHIGAAYFLKEGKPISEKEDFDELWELRLEGLLTEYLRGTGNESKLKDLKTAYESGKINSDDSESDE